MQFAPKPENDFAHYIRTYYDECRARFGPIQAIAGKWMFRDLIPGLSDFDTRFIVADDVGIDDWCRMSTAVGEAHLALCRKCPAWARNLEHLPGVNLTWSELTSAATYYPEYQQWSFYDSSDRSRLSSALGSLGERPWDRKDEYFHLKKFCLYYGRYDRTIDPAINLGVHENKYPLHSRLMHYFTPPVQSAVSILERRAFAGKFEALERASQLFPEQRCWALAWEILRTTYESPEWYTEPRLTQLEDALEDALAAIAKALREHLTILPDTAGGEVKDWKACLADIPIDVGLVIFDNAKFSRLMKGRLHFYANAPAHFDFTWLIQNELSRIGKSFFVVPFRAFWQLRTGEIVDDPVTILDDLRGDVLSAEEIACTKEFHRLTPGHWEKGSETRVATAIVEVFDGFFSALTKISEAVGDSREP